MLVNRAIIVNKNGTILLVQRSAKDSYMPNKWELPGGKLDVGQDISNALEREILEETGLVVMPTDKTAYWHSEIVASGKHKGLPYVGLIGIARIIGGEVVISEEHQDFKWLKVKDALKLDLVPETRSAISVLSDRLKNSKK